MLFSLICICSFLTHFNMYTNIGGGKFMNRHILYFIGNQASMHPLQSFPKSWDRRGIEKEREEEGWEGVPSTLSFFFQMVH